MGSKSRSKGKRGEREVAALCKKYFPDYSFRSTPLSGGWGGNENFKTCGDIVTDHPDWDYTIEVKYQERFSFLDVLLFRGLVKEWYEQAYDEADKNGNLPLLVFKKNYVPWCVLTPSFLDSRLSSAIINVGSCGLVFMEFEKFLQLYSKSKEKGEG